MIPTGHGGQSTKPGRLTTGIAVIAVSLLMFSGCASPRQAQDRPLTQAPKEWNVPVKPFRIVDNVYYVGASGMSSYLVATPSGLILLDCGTDETAAQILSNIRQLGFDPHQVKLLVGLHGHYDHVGGAAAIQRATGAKLWVGAADRALVESGGRNDPQFGDTFAWPRVKVDRALRDGDTIKLGGVELQVHTTPGHTAGAITCTQKVKNADKDCAVVFVGSVSCPEYKLVGNPRYPGVANDFVRTFKTLNSLPCDVFLTEHGWDCALADKMKRLAQAGANPFLDPDGYRQYLAGAESRFDELLRKQSVPARRKPEAVTGILGALPVEIQMLEAQLQEKRTVTFLGVAFHTGTLNGRQVVLAVGGVGKVNASKTAALLLDHFHPAEVLFTGVAGGLNPDLAPGDIVLGEKTAQHDFGELTAEGFHPKPTGKEMPLLMNAPERLLALAEAASREAALEKVPTTQGERMPRVVRGVIVTGDVFVASAAKTAELRRVFRADAVEMEGGAVAQICWQQKVPCLVIRCVSDKADAAAGADFERFVSAAAANSARLTLALLNRLAKTEEPHSITP